MTGLSLKNPNENAMKLAAKIAKDSAKSKLVQAQIDEEAHKKLRMYCLSQGITVKQWIETKISELQ